MKGEGGRGVGGKRKIKLGRSREKQRCKIKHRKRAAIQKEEGETGKKRRRTGEQENNVEKRERRGIKKEQKMKARE